MMCKKIRRGRNPEKNELHPHAKQLGFLTVPDVGHLKTRWKDDHSEYHFHVTAGWQDQLGKSFMLNFDKRGLCTDFMEESGLIFTNRPWDRCGSHLGKAIVDGKKWGSWKGGGMEMACGGKLDIIDDKAFTWFGKEVLPENVRYVTRADGYHATGYFEKLKVEQEVSMARVIRGMYELYGTRFWSHDDVSGYRGKTDVGGCLSMPFDQFVKRSLMGSI